MPAALVAGYVEEKVLDFGGLAPAEPAEPEPKVIFDADVATGDAVNLCMISPGVWRASKIKPAEPERPAWTHPPTSHDPGRYREEWFWRTSGDTIVAWTEAGIWYALPFNGGGRSEPYDVRTVVAAVDRFIAAQGGLAADPEMPKPAPTIESRVAALEATVKQLLTVAAPTIQPDLTVEPEWHRRPDEITDDRKRVWVVDVYQKIVAFLDEDDGVWLVYANLYGHDFLLYRGNARHAELIVRLCSRIPEVLL